MTLNPNKCNFFTNRIDYLGHFISCALDVSKYQPEQLTYLQTRIPDYSEGTPIIFGAVNVFRLYVPKFACVAALLKNKHSRGQPQTFDGLDDDKSPTSETLKAKLVESFVLALSRSQWDYTVDTGTCEKQIGYVLLQKQPGGTDTPIEYWARSLKDAERTYDTHIPKRAYGVWSGQS